MSRSSAASLWLDPVWPESLSELFTYYLKRRLPSHVGFNLADAAPTITPAIACERIVTCIQLTTAKLAIHMANVL